MSGLCGVAYGLGAEMSLGEADLTAFPAEAAGLLSNARQTAPEAPSQQALTVARTDSGPLISGPASLLWTGVGAVLLIFFLAFFILLRSRMGRASSVSAAPRQKNEKRQRKALKTDFFEPAGEDAEITFDDEPTRPARAPHQPSPPAAHPKAHQGDLAKTADEEAEVVIERPADAPPPKPGAFAGLFAKKQQPQPDTETAQTASLVKMKSHPLASERQREQEETGEAPAPRRVFADDIRLEQQPGPDDGARLLAEQRAAEDRRIAAERMETERRRLEAEETERERMRRAAADRAAAEAARLAAEREADFERRKKAAALEQRERELAQWAEELAGENDAFKRGVGDEVDRRFTALSERLEEKIRDLSETARRAPEIAAAIAALRRDLDQRLFEINERLETRLVGAAEIGDASTENVAAMAEMVSRRIADHRESINATIAALSNRIDSFAGAAEEVAALRKDISSLKRAIGERAHGPNAPMVQLADLVRNSLPPDAFELRASLANNRKADCLIRLPYPPGPIAIDARFPVEAFQALFAAGESDKSRAENEFRRVALRHVVDIAERLIVPEETAESALMFIPSESMYATLHERFPDIVQDSYRARVWIVSPTTLMATLHTVRAVMRDAQTRESAELIHTEAQHVLAEVDALRRRVIKLEEDFGRAHHDVRDVLSGADQVFRRAESISKTHRTLADEMLARGSKRIISVEEEPASENDADADEDEAPPHSGGQPFPLR